MEAHEQGDKNWEFNAFHINKNVKMEEVNSTLQCLDKVKRYEINDSFSKFNMINGNQNKLGL